MTLKVKSIRLLPQHLTTSLSQHYGFKRTQQEQECVGNLGSDYTAFSVFFGSEFHPYLKKSRRDPTPSVRLERDAHDRLPFCSERPKNKQRLWIHASHKEDAMVKLSLPQFNHWQKQQRSVWRVYVCVATGFFWFRISRGGAIRVRSSVDLVPNVQHSNAFYKFYYHNYDRRKWE